VTKVQVRKASKHYPSMTARDFWLIADVIGRLSNQPSKRIIIAEFSKELAHTNPNFNPDVFEKACLVSKETN